MVTIKTFKSKTEGKRLKTYKDSVNAVTSRRIYFLLNEFSAFIFNLELKTMYVSPFKIDFGLVSKYRCLKTIRHFSTHMQLRSWANARLKLKFVLMINSLTACVCSFISWSEWFCFTFRVYRIKVSTVFPIFLSFLSFLSFYDYVFPYQFQSKSLSQYQLTSLIRPHINQ